MAFDYVMKRHFIPVFCLIISIICSAHAGPGPGAWGYILHTSRLSDNYLEAVIPAYSVIAITGFRLAADGSLKTEQNRLIKRTIALTRRHWVSLYPLISFTSPEAGTRLCTIKKFCTG